MLKKKKTGLITLLIVVIAVCSLLVFRSLKKQHHVKINAANIAIDSAAKLWYKSAIIYTLDVEVFKDSDDDGVGDFNGLIQKLPYIDSLGVNVIWLAPFQPTPNQDDGYDVTDYLGIDKRLGTVGDFNAFMSAADKLHIRVVMDLVLNHTSREHTWFKQARLHKLSSYKNWYTWSKEKPKNYNAGVVFPGVQTETWTYDSLAKEYYYHRFYDFQPDLNMQNTAVQAEVRKIVKYWIGMGISGFSFDAVPFFIEVPKTKGEKFEHQFELITQLRKYIGQQKDDVIMLGEANVLPKETTPYFGTSKNVNDGMQMIFNFFVNQHLFYALATGDVRSLKQALVATGNIPKPAHWAQFLRNHDELDLGRLSRRQRSQVYEKFAPEKTMQLYDRGIRRRLAPMFNNDRKLIELAYSVLFSIPGTPVIGYGDEIGMGDNLSLKDLQSVRTPMQWTADTAGDFSSSGKAIIPVIDTGIYGYRKTNVASASKQATSLLNWTKLVIKVRKQCPEIILGNNKILETGNAHILLMRYEWQGNKLLVIHNFSKKDQKLSITKKNAGGSILKNLFSSGENLKTGKDNLHVALEGYGYRWYKVGA